MPLILFTRSAKLSTGFCHECYLCQKYQPISFLGPSDSHSLADLCLLKLFIFSLTGERTTKNQSFIAKT